MEERTDLALHKSFLEEPEPTVEPDTELEELQECSVGLEV